MLSAGLGSISSWVWVTSQELLPTAIPSLFVPPVFLSPYFQFLAGVLEAAVRKLPSLRPPGSWGG